MRIGYQYKRKKTTVKRGHNSLIKKVDKCT